MIISQELPGFFLRIQQNATVFHLFFIIFQNRFTFMIFHDIMKYM